MTAEWIVIEKIEEYQDLIRELKKLWDMKIVVYLIALGALGTSPKDVTRRTEGHWHQN